MGFSDNKTNGSIRIIPYTEQHKEDFVRLSTLWILTFAQIEECDKKIFADPHGQIVATGGRILVAWDDARSAVAGVCALQYHKDRDYWELIKLCVDPVYRNRGIGDMLIDAIADAAREQGARELYLETASPLAPAIRLYFRKGFIELPYQGGHYARADVKMVKDLTRP